jgi:DNA-binding response OmpR family regulator
MATRKHGRPAMTRGETLNRGRVLIIEPDDLIRGLIVRWLTEPGYILTADASQSNGIGLVIADVPNPAQADAALQDLRARYDAPILAISARFGREHAASKGAARRLGVARVLPKPFTCEELLAAVQDCLGNS